MLHQDFPSIFMSRTLKLAQIRSWTMSQGQRIFLTHVLLHKLFETKIVMNSAIILLVDGTIVKINSSPFCWGPHEAPLRDSWMSLDLLI